MRDERTTLVLTKPDAEATWQGPGVIPLVNYALLEAALHAGVSEYGREIARVIFVGSITAERFLSFLAGLPIGFRGDVLFIQRSGEAFLSAVSRDDGRYLYSLTPRDVEFYRETTFAQAEEATPQRAARAPIAQVS
ncbi:MAG: hypothetical protein ACRD2J_03650 [Thermoanaerobaculia bacterium]